MVEYICEKCAKVFKQKGNYDKHNSRKNTCVLDKNIETMIEQKVEEKVNKSAATAATATATVPKIDEVHIQPQPIILTDKR